MATWTGAAPTEAEDLFKVLYRRLWSMRQSEVSDALDVAAGVYIRPASVFVGTQRTAAVVHMAAHLLQSSPADGEVGLAGGALKGRTNERGSQSFQTASPGQWFGVDEYILQSTEGGRNLLAMKVRNASTAAYS